MRIGVLGAGAMGSLFAARLAGTDAAVTLLAHESEHVAAVRRDGLALERPDGSRERRAVPAVTSPADAPALDVVLVLVKSTDTASAADEWREALADAAVCTLQNGLGNAETLAERVPRERVLAGTTSHGAVVERPGLVRHAGVGDTVLGRYFAPTDDTVRALAAALTDAGVETAVTDDPAGAVWRKALVNVGINAPTALARVENGALADTESGGRVLRRAVVEAARVARAEGVAVGDPVAAARRVAERTATNRSSMRQDVEARRETEVEALYGAVVSRARDHDLPVPVTATLADLVRLAQGSSGRGQS
ncbi:MAG: ketopantoate reductase family protein [Halarchaeum sp.]